MPKQRKPKKRRSKTTRASSPQKDRGKRARPTPKRVKKSARKQTHKKSARKKTAKKKRSSVGSKRSLAAKKAWAKRRKKMRLIESMNAANWREIALPTKDELYDHLLWLSEQLEVDIAQMYLWYWGSDDVEVVM